MVDQPAATVIIIIDKHRDRAELSLGSILNQSNVADLEILLIDLSSSDTPAVPGSDHANVKVARMPDALRTATWGEVRAEAVHMARGPLVLFLEEHSAALPGWAEATIAALNEEYTGVSGQVVNDHTRVRNSDAVKLMTDAPPLLRNTRRPTRQPFWGNAVYRRDALLELGDALAPLLQNETMLGERLAQDGHKIGEDGAIRFVHVREATLHGHGRGAFHLNRSTARLRTKLFKWSPRNMLLAVLGAPFTAWIRTFKIVRYWQKKDASRLGLVLRNLPRIVLINYYATIGQALGIALGEGQSGNRYLNYAVNVDRPLPDMARVLRENEQAGAAR